MSSKDLVEDLNHLRIKYGTSNVYKTLLTLLRTEFEELSSLFGVSSGNMPSSIFYPTNSTEFYKEYMEVAAQAAHDTLEEHPVLSSGFYDSESNTLEAQSINGDEFSLSPEEDAESMDLIHQILNDISYSASSSNSPETPVGEDTNTQELPLKIIQTGGSAAPEASHNKKLLKKKAASETVEVIKETAASAKPKKISKNSS
jgi:hypothetical protein